MNLEKGQVIKVHKGKNGYFTFLNRYNKLIDSWAGACIYLQFKKGVEPNDKSEIKINEAWLSCYESKKSNKTVLYIFINDFDLVLNND